MNSIGNVSQLDFDKDQKYFRLPNDFLSDNVVVPPLRNRTGQWWYRYLSIEYATTVVLIDGIHFSLPVNPNGWLVFVLSSIELRPKIHEFLALKCHWFFPVTHTHHARPLWWRRRQRNSNAAHEINFESTKKPLEGAKFAKSVSISIRVIWHSSLVPFRFVSISSTSYRLLFWLLFDDLYIVMLVYFKCNLFWKFHSTFDLCDASVQSIEKHKNYEYPSGFSSIHSSFMKNTARFCDRTRKNTQTTVMIDICHYNYYFPTLTRTLRVRSVEFH